MPPLDPYVLKNLDPSFEQRAKKLMEHAENGARQTHPTVALRQWWHDLDGWGAAKETGVKGAASFGVAVAGAAIASAGVATAAVTFGIGPALGLVVGLTVSKGISEVRYQSASNRLRRAIRDEADPSIYPLENLPDGVSKVLKKYLRVARRAKMLGGGAKGFAYNVRHLKTTIKAQFGAAATGAARLSTKYDDRDLNERLQEFRYYGQMTLNTVSAHLKKVVRIYGNLLDQAGNTYVHIMRQVHFTGNHENCGSFSCYNLSQSDFRRNVAALKPAPAKGNVITRGYHETQHFKQVRAEIKTDALPAAKAAYPGRQAAMLNTNNLIGHITRAQGKPFKATPTSLSDLIEPEERAIEYGSGVTTDALGAAAAKSKGFAEGVSEWSSELGNTGGPVAEGLGPAGAGTGIGVGLDLFVGFVKERFQRHKTRERVLQKSKVVMGLLEKEQQLIGKEMEHLVDLLQADDKTHALRIVEKVLWYGDKITALESDRDYMQMRVAMQNVDFSHSVFPSCDKAYAQWYITHYLVRQYVKLITNLVFLEIILLQLDRKLATMDIGVKQGDLIKEDIPTPARPAHMKDIND